MKFTDIFIRRPVLAIVVNLVILVGGIQAARSLNVRQYPRLESATITVRTVYVGANADLVRGFITTPLERSIAAADGIDYVESQSVQGLSTINVRLKLNFNAGNALADISARVNQVRADLPPEAEIPSINIEPSDAQIAAMYLSFASNILEDNQITDYLIRIVQPRLSALDGVQRADILGGRAFAIRAWLKPERMAAHNISPAQVRAALAANNFLAAVGQTKGALVQANLTTTTDLRSVDEFKKLVVFQREGTLVRLQDVADVELGAETYDQDVRVSGQRAVFMGIWVLPTANSLDVIGRVRKELEIIDRELPTGMEAKVAFDSTTYIEDAIHEVVHTLLETVLIVIIVIFLFLGSLRTVVVPIVAIPVSLIGAVFLMQVFGFTLNLLTLLAIVLSVGLVVDDAIVVVENVERHVRQGTPPVEAALISARELVGPIVAMTITLAAVYVPIGFQGGLTGALFREFAFTLAGAVFISGIVALTLSPMMSSRLIPAEHGHGWLVRHIERVFDRVRRAYDSALAKTLRARKAVYVVWMVLAIVIVPMYLFSPAELAPNEDQGGVFTSLDVPPNASLEQVSGYATEVDHLFQSEPEFDHSFQLTFSTGGFGGMITKPWSERKRTIFPILESLNTKSAGVAGVRAPMFLPPALPSPGLFPVEFVISSTASHDEIMRFADQLVLEAQHSGQFAFPPVTDVKIDQTKTEIVIDRDKVAAMGLTMQQVGSDLGAALGGNFVNRFNIDGRSYKVIPQVQRVSRLTPDQLEQIYITGPSGELVKLGAVATLKDSIEPRTLNRFQQLNSVKLSGVATRSLDGALKVMEDTAEKTLPQGYHIDYTGESRQLRQEGGKFLPAMGLAILLIFLVLAAQFNSFRDPLVILGGSVPLAMFGALIFTFLKFAGPPGLRFPLTQGFTTTLNIYSQVGLVTLIGLVSKNGILIVEFANTQQQLGLSKIEAVRVAAETRLRPILMTTIATVAGHFPLTLVTGPGAVARNSIGVVLVGGMAIGTVFTLFVVPAVYVLIAKDHQRERLHRAKLSVPPGTAAQPAE
ncbi:RND multidrug efflux transporter [Labilithrix luteola]|uniref:RND multidrug efflux transporter n=1 Tax=Labilithrix luteola TaxID=1391654 RepID=A0A0K1QFH0_9BACT|nr:efflux RND transporter permease subunit [Labilithrix luteola]AKV04509.1 RND multidrug efflux transporter [Labilithrix luteola]